MRDQILASVPTLEQNIQHVRSVNEWALMMGFRNPKTFSRLFRNHYGIRPKKLMDELRLDAIKRAFLTMEDDKYYCIALEVGLEDEQALYKFVKNHLGINPTQLKEQVLSQRLMVA